MTTDPQSEYGWTQPDNPAAPPAQPVGDALAMPQVQAQQQFPMQGYQQQAAPMVVPKNGAVAVILSFFIPGLGSMVNGAVGKGVLILAVYVIGWILTIVLIGIPIAFGAWIWGMVDAYLSAQKWNQAHGIIS